MLGVVLSLPGIADTVRAATQAEQAGLESVWTTEFPDRSATISLAAVAQATERVTVGSAIAYAFGRTPLVLAAEARDLDDLSERAADHRAGHRAPGACSRTGTASTASTRRAGWRSSSHCCGDLLRLHEGPIQHEGRFYRTVVKPTAPVAPPLRTDLPIYMARRQRADGRGGRRRGRRAGRPPAVHARVRARRGPSGARARSRARGPRRAAADRRLPDLLVSEDSRSRAPDRARRRGLQLHRQDLPPDPQPPRLRRAGRRIRAAWRTATSPAWPPP